MARGVGWDEQGQGSEQSWYWVVGGTEVELVAHSLAWDWSAALAPGPRQHRASAAARHPRTGVFMRCSEHMYVGSVSTYCPLRPCVLVLQKAPLLLHYRPKMDLL